MLTVTVEGERMSRISVSSNRRTLCSFFRCFTFRISDTAGVTGNDSEALRITLAMELSSIVRKNKKGRSQKQMSLYPS